LLGPGRAPGRDWRQQGRSELDELCLLAADEAEAAVLVPRFARAALDAADRRAFRPPSGRSVGRDRRTLVLMDELAVLCTGHVPDENVVGGVGNETDDKGERQDEDSTGSRGAHSHRAASLAAMPDRSQDRAVTACSLRHRRSADLQLRRSRVRPVRDQGSSPGFSMATSPPPNLDLDGSIHDRGLGLSNHATVNEMLVRTCNFKRPVTPSRTQSAWTCVGFLILLGLPETPDATVE
jgi:hypothetical protein